MLGGAAVGIRISVGIDIDIGIDDVSASVTAALDSILGGIARTSIGVISSQGSLRDCDASRRERGRG